MSIENDPTDIEAVEQAEHDRADARKNVGKQEAEDFKWIMSNKRGRRFIRNLLADAGLHRTSMTGNSMTFFKEGERNLGLKIEAKLNDYAFDQYLVMLKEGNDEEKQ